MLTKFTLSARERPRLAISSRNSGAPGMVGRHQHIGRRAPGALRGERLPHASAEEGDARYAANGEHKGEREHA